MFINVLMSIRTENILVLILMLQLVYYCQFMDMKQAISFEKKIKKWSQAKKSALIEGRFENLPNLAKKNFKK